METMMELKHPRLLEKKRTSGVIGVGVKTYSPGLERGRATGSAPFPAGREVALNQILIHGFPLATNREVRGAVACLLVPKFRNCLLQYSS